MLVGDSPDSRQGKSESLLAIRHQRDRQRGHQSDLAMDLKCDTVID